MKPDGLVMRSSHYGPKETMDRLVAAVTEQGMTVMARFDHSEAARTVGMTLRPTELLIFGNPKAGTVLMQGAKTLGIDLPLRALVWQDDAGNTCLTYYDPKWLATRHGASGELVSVLEEMTTAITAAVHKAAKG